MTFPAIEATMTKSSATPRQCKSRGCQTQLRYQCVHHIATLFGWCDPAFSGSKPWKKKGSLRLNLQRTWEPQFMFHFSGKAGGWMGLVSDFLHSDRLRWDIFPITHEAVGHYCKKYPKFSKFQSLEINQTHHNYLPPSSEFSMDKRFFMALRLSLHWWDRWNLKANIH